MDDQCFPLIELPGLNESKDADYFTNHDNVESRKSEQSTSPVLMYLEAEATDFYSSLADSRIDNAHYIKQAHLYADSFFKQVLNRHEELLRIHPWQKDGKEKIEYTHIISVVYLGYIVKQHVNRMKKLANEKVDPFEDPSFDYANRCIVQALIRTRQLYSTLNWQSIDGLISSLSRNPLSVDRMMITACFHQMHEQLYVYPESYDPKLKKVDSVEDYTDAALEPIYNDLAILLSQMDIHCGLLHKWSFNVLKDRGFDMRLILQKAQDLKNQN